MSAHGVVLGDDIAHLIDLGDDMTLPLKFRREHPEDLRAYAERIDAMAGGALRGASAILRRDEGKGEESGAPGGAVDAVEAAEFLRRFALALRESAAHAAT